MERMPPDEPGLAPVIRLPVKPRPSLPTVPVARPSLSTVPVVPLQDVRTRRMKWGVLLAGAFLVGLMGSLLMMAIDSVDEEAGPVRQSEEGASFEDVSPFRSSSGAQPDLSGPAWFSTGQGKDSQ